jgi:hypothetical protein
VFRGQPTIGGAFLGSDAPSGTFLANLWNRLTDDFNDALRDYANGVGAIEGQSALFVDIADFIADLEANPVRFGFSNVTSDIFTDGADVSDQSYFSVDGIHPTGAGHAAIAEFVMQTAASAGFDLTTMAGNVLPGSDRDDMLTGTPGPDTIAGLDGFDAIIGGDGVDTAVLRGPQDRYTLTIGPDDTILTDRSGADGTDTLRSIERLDFADGTFDLSRFDGGATLSDSAFRSLTEVYVSYFDRAPDALGLLFWADAFASGVSLQTIADAFAASDEARSVFPESLSKADFVTTVYQNSLGRDPDADGFAFWSDALASGFVTRGQFVLSVLQGARTAPPEDARQEFIDQQAIDRTYLDGKIDVGLYLAIDLGVSDVAAASDVMSVYDGSEASRTQALAIADHLFEVASAVDGTGQFLVQLVGVSDDPGLV